MQAAPKTAPDLLRELNVWHAIAIVAGTIIGSGIFRVQGVMMREVGSAGLVYLVWVVGGLLGFLYAWTWFLIAKPASIATVTTGIVDVLGTFPSLSFLSNHLFTLQLTRANSFEVTYGT